MKKLLSLILLCSVFVSSSVLADIQIDNSDIPLSVCVGHWGFIDASGELDNFIWSTDSWGSTFAVAKDWSPNHAGIRLRSDLNGIYKMILRFQMSSSDIQKFKKTFNGTSTRIPTALEVDILDKDNLLGEPGVNDFSIISTNVPSEALLIEDVSASDSMNQLSAIIMRPDKLKANTLYEIVFEPDGNVRESTGRFQVNWQLSINYKWITAMKNNSSSQCDLMGLIDYLKDQVQNDNHNAGFNLVSSNYSNDIPSKVQSGWYYFVASKKTDASNDVQTSVYNGMIKDLVCWNDDTDESDDHHSNSGVSYCTDDNGNNLFMNPLGSYYPTQCTANSDGGITCTIGNHTHIIHDDYRCSKELPNGPILCWEAGGDTNCWDANTWYEMTCNVEEVPVLRNDSNYKITRSRDYTCNEVYSSDNDNGSSQSSSGNSGYQTTPVPDDTQNENQTLPDFVIQKLILTDSNGNERYRFYKNEEVKMRDLLTTFNLHSNNI